MSEQELIYRLLRGALQGQPAYLGTAPLDSTAWWRLFQLSQHNHVTALTADTVASLDISREVLIPWLTEKEKTIDWHRQQQEVQQEIVNAMQQHGIDTLVLKGTHVAQYWPQPEAREFGDLDLYFYDKHEEADRVAREVLRVKVTNEAHHHSRYDYRGVTVESHYDFVNRHYPPSNRRYEAMLKELCPSATFEVLFLLRHMAGHFAASRITLRDLVDWALTCRALQGQVDWTMVENTIAQYGMDTFARALGTIAEHHFDIPMPLTLHGPDRDIVSRLERDIVYGTVSDHAADGMGRLSWKMRRWQALDWKRKLVYNDNPLSLTLTSLVSHAEKPRSILHKM